jgi:uncharacterized phiE125 gp8 family phage protein
LKIVQVTPPAIEPVTLSELKVHLRLDSGTFDGNLVLTQSLPYGSKAITDNYTTHVGAWVEVLGKQAVVEMHCGTNGATGTVDTKIQESDDGITGADWPGGAFTQVTTANDNADYKLPYTGSKRYVRTVSRVLGAACEFGTSVLVNAATTAEDDLLNSIIMAAREHVEDVTRRQILTATYDYFLQEWPCDDFIALPLGCLQSVTSVKWKDTDGIETTLTENTDYIVETNGDQYGRIVLPYGGSWPSGTLYPSNPITIRFICGWTAAPLVPGRIKSAILLICADLYENREGQIVAQTNSVINENKTVDRLLWPMRLW